MKKLINILIVASFVFAAVSCVKENTPSYDEALQQISMKFAVETDSYSAHGTKADFDGLTGNVAFENGDLVSVFPFTKTANSKFTVEVDVDILSPYIYGICPLDESYIAVSPYDAQATFDGTTVTTSLPAVQTALPGNFSTYLAVGQFSDNKFSFKNVCGLVRVILADETATSIIFSGNSDEIVAGGVQITNPAEPDWTSVSATASQTMTLEAENGTLTPGTYFIPVLPQKFDAGFTIKVMSGSTLLSEKVVSSAVEIVRSSGVKGADFCTDLGAGTEDDPYRIATLYHLQNMISNVNTDGAYRDAHYIQIADINVDGTLNVAANTSDLAFTGTYDGQGYKIGNATLNNEAGDGNSIGLFGYVNGNIKNVVMYKPSVSYSSTTAATGVAAVVGMLNSDGQVSGCIVEGGSVTYTGGAADGTAAVVGYANGPVSYCEARDVTVTATRRSGAVVGRNSAKVSYCKAVRASVTATSWHNGIIVGHNDAAVEYCEAINSSITAKSEKTAPIVGAAYAPVNNCSSFNCTVSTTKYAGGIVGIAANTSATISNCTVEGFLTPTAISGGYTGGIVGETSANISGCKVLSSIIKTGSTSRLGGILGFSSAAATASDCVVNNVILDGVGERVGGIAGNLDGSGYTLSNCRVYNSIVRCPDSTGGGNVGGIVGTLGKCSKVLNCHVSNTTVAAAYKHNIGAIVGFADGRASGGMTYIENSTADSGVYVYAGGGTCGGVAGRVDHGVVSGCVSAAKLELPKEKNKVGGIVGDLQNNYIKCIINNIYYGNTITASSAENAGGIIGNVANAASGSYVVNNATYPTSITAATVSPVSGGSNANLRIANNYSSLAKVAIGTLNAGVATYQNVYSNYSALPWVTGNSLIDNAPTLEGSILAGTNKSYSASSAGSYTVESDWAVAF